MLSEWIPNCRHNLFAEAGAGFAKAEEPEWGKSAT